MVNFLLQFEEPARAQAESAATNAGTGTRTATRESPDRDYSTSLLAAMTKTITEVKREQQDKDPSRNSFDVFRMPR